MGSMFARLFVLSLGALLAACGGGNSSLPQSVAAPSSVFPTLQLAIGVDGRGSATAIVGVSRVTFDASGTAADKLRYDVQFGDGASSSAAVSSHVYSTVGSFTATVTVTDAAGRQMTTSETVVVKSLEGTWFHAGYNERSRLAEARRFTIVTQEGASLRGVYASLGSADQPFTGTLTGERTVRLALEDGSLQFEGSVPNESQVEGGDWPLTVRGGSADGLTLPFTPAIGEPTGPPPRASLSVRYRDTRAFRAVFMGLTPITFDASGSSGERLAYLIEFGDEEYTTEPTAVHASNRFGPMVARVIVVDRFGRFDTESERFEVSSLQDRFGSWWYNAFTNPRTGRTETRNLRFLSHEGRHVAGSYRHPEGWWSAFSGTLDGNGGIQLVLDDRTIAFTGTIDWHQTFRQQVMWLAVRGGSADGMTLDFFWNDGPG